MKQAVIFTDSQSAITAIEGVGNFEGYPHYIIIKIKVLLFELFTEGRQIKLVWIPSHKGIAGNERVDRLAKEARVEGKDQGLQLPYADLHAEANKLPSEDFSDPGHPHGRPYFENFFKFGKKPWFYDLSLNRDEVVLTCRMRSNHYNLAYWLHRKNMADSPLCECDRGQVEDLNHVY